MHQAWPAVGGLAAIEMPKNLLLAGSLMVLLIPAAATAQSSFDGTWKLDLGSLPVSKTTFVGLLQDGTYQCKSCTPPINVKADGQDQPTPGQPYDTISVSVLNDRTVREIEKKNGQTVSDETFTVSADGKTATDEFAGWKMTMSRLEKGLPGSHALSGSWRQFKMESTSDKDLLTTYKLEGDTLIMTRPTGQSYRAKLDGTDAPYIGEPRFDSVSVKRIDASTIEETDKFNGKTLTVLRVTVNADGKTMTIAVNDLESGTTGQFTASKQ